MRKYLLAVGVGEVHGLGAAAVYGPHPLLSYREFETAWAIQQRLVEHAQDPEATTKRSHIKTALELERQGVLDMGYAPLPTGLPFDPGPAG